MDRILGTLLGTAVGDALGLPAEGMTAKSIARRWGRLDRYRLLGPVGFVSDDTEQAALVAQSLARHPGDAQACAAAFRKSLVGWFLRLPFGVGLATVRACIKAGVGVKDSGVDSAGNGAAMRSAVVGAYLKDQPERRRAFAEALARVTHTDARAVESAVFVAEVAAHCGSEPVAALRAASASLRHPELLSALAKAFELVSRSAGVEEAVSVLGNSGYCVQTVAFASFLFGRFGSEPRQCLVETVSAGGDADSIGAVVGGWLGALHGAEGLPPELVAGLCPGPFGRRHLEKLARSLNEGTPPPCYLWPVALLRNLALYPVILAHGLRRLLPL